MWAISAGSISGDTMAGGVCGVTSKDPLTGKTLHPGPAIRFDGEKPEDVVRWTGPAAGAHTDFVLHTLLGLPKEAAR